MTKWEPREALLAGPDGLDAYPQLHRPSSPFVRPCRNKERTRRAVVALEVGEGQAGAVSEMLREAGFAEIEARLDLAGIERVVVGRR